MEKSLPVSYTHLVKIMEKDKDFLGTEPIGKLLLRLAIPTLAAQLINMLYNVVDRIYIGHIPKVGALALTGVGVCMPLIMIVSAFAVLVGNGGAPRASIYMGQNNKEDAEKTLGNCFATQILVAIVLTIVLLLGNRTFLLAFGASENTISYAAAYMNIYAVGTIFVQLTLGSVSYTHLDVYKRQVHCGIISSDTGERAGHSMAAEGYATLRAYNSGNTVHTLMVFDGWGDTVRYLNFDFDSWTDISGDYI